MEENIVIGLKVDSVDEIYKMGFLLMEDTKYPLKNNLPELLKERKMTAAELAKRTGTTRQSTSYTTRGKMRPSIEFAMKAAVVLKVSVEDIFELTEGAWIEPIATFSETAVFLDMVNLEIVGRKERTRREKERKALYYDLQTKVLLTKEEMAEIERDFKRIHQKDRMNSIKKSQQNMEYSDMLAEVNMILEEELSERYGLLYKRIGKSIAPKEEE